MERLPGLLHWRYVLSLIAIAILVSAGHFVTQHSLRQQLSDARVVNLAGRQRMLSQRLAKAALMQPSSAQRKVLAADLHEFRRIHRGLQVGDADRGLPPSQSPQIAGLFATLEPDFQGTVAPLEAMLERDAQAPMSISGPQRQALVDTILRHEAKFLTTMDKIVFRFDEEARARVARTQQIEVVLLLLALAILLFEALFIFRPIVHQLQDALSGLVRTRNALARTEAEQQAMLQALPDGLARLTADGHLIVLRASGPGLFGIAMRTGEPQKLDALPDSVVSAFARCRKELRDPAVDVSQQVLLRPEARDLTFELRAVRAQGIGHLVTVRDITKQRRLEAEVLEATERARTSVGRELHDGLCQHLAGVALLARARARDPETNELAQLLDDGVAQARELALGLYPATLANLGLTGALEEVVRHVETVSELSCSETLPDHPISVSEDTALQLFRIAQEAAANVVKHANARHLWVRLHEDEERLELKIEDDGIGLPLQPDRRSGLGLDTMAYRARLINGDLSIVTRPSGGTMVRCRITRSEHMG